MIENASRHEKKQEPDGAPLIRLVAFNARYTHSCMALFYLREELAKYLPSATVQILQLTINDNDYESLLRITADEPFAIFFSAAIWNSEKTLRLIEDVHLALPECQIVAGGPEAGVIRSRVSSEKCSVVVGEIEAVDPLFYKHLISGHLQASYEGRFLRMPARELFSPYCDDDFAGALANRHIYYESSRGCPYGCTYCLSATERGVFHKPISQVEQELTDILKHRPKVIRFIDRTFNDVPERALAIWRFLLQQDCDTLFHFEIAPERFNEEMFGLLEQVGPGRFQFEVGIQSTHPETLEAIRRKIDIKGVTPIITRLATLRSIHLHVDLILGLPYETKESFARSFANVFRMGAHYIQMGLLKILPDTPICQGAVEYGYVHSNRPPYAVLANNWLDHREMAELYWFCEVVEKFHNNRYFVSLWRYLRETDEDIFAFFQQLLEVAKRFELLERAATQLLLVEILVECCRKRNDIELIYDLMRYDWLRCGHRKLPDILLTSEMKELPEHTKELLHKQLDQEAEGLYGRGSRNTFFKRANFLRLGAEAARIIGLGDGEGDVRIVIMPEREESVHRHNMVKVVARLD